MKKGTLSKLISGLMVISILFLVQCAKQGGSIDSTNSYTSKAVTLTQVSSFGSNPGALSMYKYVPSGISGSAPLVIALHGCTQDASTYASDTGWATLADQYKFYVVFPQQSSSNNSNKCFNWYNTTDNVRDAGELLSIKQMVDKMKTDYSIDASRVFVTGLSAGGYYTTIVAAAYPDVFAGAAVMAGGPTKCATDTTSAYSCMYSISSKSGSTWGALVTGIYSGYTGSYPKISFWAGSSDSTVVPANMTEGLKQWAYVLGLSETPDVTETIQTNTHTIYKKNGVTLMEGWSIKGMSHGITVDPDGTNGKAGGSTDTYSFDKNVWSSYEVAKFWGLTNTDQTAPTISITSPSNGASVSGSVTISASASDNVAVTKVEIYVDGTLKSTLTASPYSYVWDSSVVSNGTHSITAKAYDAAGNVGSASAVSVTVTGGVSDTTAPVISADKAAGTYTTSVTVTLSANEAATIYYTTDGSTPTESSSVYSSALTFTATTTLKFFGKDSSGNVSSVTSITYTIDTVSYSESISATITTHYIAGRITATEYNDLGLGTNNSGINPGKIKYGYINAVTLYKLKSTGKWVTSQSI